MTGFVDPEELPFTTEELFRAGCRFLETDVARLMADHLTDCGPGMVAQRGEQREAWRAAGVPDAEKLMLHGWTYPDELLAALASLSGDVEVRARTLLEHAWALRLSSAVRAAQLAAVRRSGLIPALGDAGYMANASAVSSDKHPPAPTTLSVRVPSLPPPTAEMEFAARSLIAEQRRVWETTVARFRDRS